MIAFDRRGKGAPAVLVHGITESRRSWDPVLPALSAVHDVLRVDLRGHGESEVTPPYDVFTMATDLREVLDSEAMMEPLLIGHSLGGMVVTVYASMFGCRGVINIDQSLDLAGVQEGIRQIVPLLRDRASFPQGMESVIGGLRGALNDEEWERLQSLRRPDQEVVLGIWAPLLDLPVSELEAMVASVGDGIKVPYLVIHGSDPGDAYREWLQALIPTAEVEVWGDVGHYPHLIEPERFVERVAAFESAG